MQQIVVPNGTWRLPLLATLLLSLALTLIGCAGGPVGGPGRDIMTDSDEPEHRRRARIRLELAVGYFEQGQTTVALDELKQSLAADPNLAEAHNLRGLIYLRMNELGLAEESFRRALALNPRDPNAQHNYGWLLCQQSRLSEAVQYFRLAVAHPTYAGRAKTWMTQGLCQMSAGQPAEAELSLTRSYELDPAHPITMYNLALLQFQRGDFERAQFHVRRLNNGEYANAESLWLGIKIEHKLGRYEAVEQLAAQLRKRFARSRETGAYERGAFHE